MPTTVDEIIDAAILLGEAERFQVVTRLLDTLPNDPPGLSVDDPTFLDELERRVDELDDSVPQSQLWPHKIILG